tara:strand:+ start:3563 stop:3751 length:189 start_codon:yes stop_codon:yes gene_type:complete
MCSFNACQYNKPAKPFMIELLLKERVRLVLIAVCNKLLKQAFAIATSGFIYDNNYKSILVKN